MKTKAELLPECPVAATAGRSLQPILDAMRAWGEEYRAAKLAE